MSKIRNGVNVENIEALIGAVKENSAFSKVRCSAKSEWKGGTKAEVTVSEVVFGGQNIAEPGRSFKLLVDLPRQLGGSDEAPNPAEYLAAGLCGCLTASIAANAAVRGDDYEKIEVSVELDFDILGVIGVDRSVPPGAQELRYSVRVKGRAPRERIDRNVELSERASPVKDTLVRPLRDSKEIHIEE